MLKQWFEQVASSVEMEKQEDNPMGCGTYFRGFDRHMRGFAWYYSYRSLFAIAKCDYMISKDTRVIINDPIEYIGLRLDYARQLPPGKIIAFLENADAPATLYIKKGTRIAYTEVLYSPEFYKKHFDSAFSLPVSSPLEILKNMGTNHNWSSKIAKILTDISKCTLSGTSAELYYVAKSCELMSALIEMGTERLPRKLADCRNIQRVIHYINENYRKDIKQSDLVKLANMSPTKLKTSFRKFTDHSISEYILEKKTDQAMHLLAETDLSVEEIAKSLGFVTVSGFSTSFRKMVGASPSAYRKQLRFECITNLSYFDNIIDYNTEDLY